MPTRMPNLFNTLGPTEISDSQISPRAHQELKRIFDESILLSRIYEPYIQRRLSEVYELRPDIKIAMQPPFRDRFHYDAQMLIGTIPLRQYAFLEDYSTRKMLMAIADAHLTCPKLPLIFKDRLCAGEVSEIDGILTPLPANERAKVLDFFCMRAQFAIENNPELALSRAESIRQNKPAVANAFNTGPTPFAFLFATLNFWQPLTE